MKKKFNAINFLRNLVDDVASSEREGKQFAADPSILGPLLLSVQEELTLLTLRMRAQSEHRVNDGAVNARARSRSW